MDDPINNPKGREAAVMSVRSAAVWAISGQYVSFIIQFATSVIISRFFLTPDEVGLFSIGLAAALLVATLQDFGLSRYISGLPELGRDEIARCSSISLLFSCIIAGIIACAAVPMAALYQQPSLKPMLLIIASSYLFMPFAIVPVALMARKMQFSGHLILNVGATVIGAGVALGLAAAGYSSFALAWSTVAAAATRGVIAQLLRPALPWPLKLDGLRPVLSFGSRSSGLYLTGALGTRTPDLIVGKMLGLFSVGLYSRAVSLSDQFRTLISGAIGSVFYPAFARIRDRGEALGPAYLRVCSGYSGVVWPGMAGLALASEPLVRILYGPVWMEVAPLLAIIALTEIMLVSLPLITDIPVLLGKLNRLIALNIIDTTLSIGLLIIGCFWGVEGAAVSRLVYGVIWLFLYAGFMHRLIRFDIKALLNIYAKSALATGAAITPLAMVYLFLTGPAHTGFLTLFLATLAGGVMWLATLFVVRHPALDEFIGMASASPLRHILPLTRISSFQHRTR